MSPRSGLLVGPQLPFGDLKHGREPFLDGEDHAFAILTRQAIRRGSFPSVPDLVTAIRRFCDGWNQRRQPIARVKDADDILVKATPGPVWHRRQLQPTVGDAVAVNPTSRPSPTRLALLERLADLIATRRQAIRSGSRSTGWTRPARPAWPTSWSGR